VTSLRLITVARSDVRDSATPLVGRVGRTYYIWFKHFIYLNSLLRVCLRDYTFLNGLNVAATEAGRRSRARVTSRE
jgi:hypothetical protein